MTSVRNLRQLVPRRRLSSEEAFRLAELQANRLLAMYELPGPPVPVSLIAQLPKILVDQIAGIPVSGSAHWSGTHWVIVLHANEPHTRKRFSLAHELKHILDDPFRDFLYHHGGEEQRHRLAEAVANHFAACLLMPKRWVYAALKSGISDVTDLAHLFGGCPGFC